jgi:hypothetical protein
LSYRTAFDAVFAAYVAALFAPAVGEFAGLVAYAAALAGFWVVVYSGMLAGRHEIRGLPERVGHRPGATAVVLLPLVYGAVYVVGALVAEPPVRSPYVYLGLWNFVVGVLAVALAREAAGVGRSGLVARKER